MWSGKTSLIQPGVSKISIHPENGGDAISFRAFFEKCSDPVFADFFSGILKDTGYSGFFWECPAITTAVLENPFECVVVDSPALPRLSADAGPFANQFAKAKDDCPVIAFKNLSGDATLIAPLPDAAVPGGYAHFAVFLRDAPAEQVREFWNVTGTTALTLLSDTRFWLSTAGLGVSWLHLRFDSRPKYFRHEPYKKAAPDDRDG